MLSWKLFMIEFFTIIIIGIIVHIILLVILDKIGIVQNRYVVHITLLLVATSLSASLISEYLNLHLL